MRTEKKQKRIEDNRREEMAKDKKIKRKSGEEKNAKKTIHDT